MSQNCCALADCTKPLGQESQDLGFLTCHEHRTCAKCGLEMRPAEIKWAVDKSIESEEPLKCEVLAHARCVILETPSISQDPTLSIKQSHYDYLNLIRLMVEPDLNLSIQTNEQTAMIQSTRLLTEMDFDHLYVALKKLEACVAQVSIALSQDRKKLKERASERERESFKRAQSEARTSARPSGKPANDEKEIMLAAFMERNAIADRSIAIKIKRDRDKAILALVAMGIPEAIAQESVDKDLTKRGILK
jgi:hypothetical protein